MILAVHPGITSLELCEHFAAKVSFSGFAEYKYTWLAQSLTHGFFCFIFFSLTFLSMLSTHTTSLLLSFHLAAATSARLRMHCTLQLFRMGAAALRVGRHRRLWKDGECFVFDESYEHEVFVSMMRLRVVDSAKHIVSIVNRCEYSGSILSDRGRCACLC